MPMRGVLSKQAAREWAKQQRRALTEAEYECLNTALLERLKALFNWQSITYIHVFLPILRQREPDLRPLLDFIRQEVPALKVMVPKVKDASLEHYYLLPGMELQMSPWGVPEPLDTAPLVAPSELENIDLVLVPLLAFDRCGRRVGYGKGYYDTFLSSLPHALRVGLSLLPPLEKIEDIEPHDVPLHLVVTPAQVYDFRLAAEKATHAHLIKTQSSVP
jgi:5-formyltetrahydrofolate cyclo-ligase